MSAEPFSGSIEVLIQDEAGEDVTISINQSPWVSGMRAVKYAGPIDAKGHCQDIKGFEDLLHRVCGDLARKAHALEATHIVGTDFGIDPFKELDGEVVIMLSAMGTAALLEPIW